MLTDPFPYLAAFAPSRVPPPASVVFDEVSNEYRNVTHLQVERDVVFGGRADEMFHSPQQEVARSVAEADPHLAATIVHGSIRSNIGEYSDPTISSRRTLNRLLARSLPRLWM